MIYFFKAFGPGKRGWFLLDANHPGSGKQKTQSTSRAAPETQDQDMTGAGTEHSRKAGKPKFRGQSRPIIGQANAIDLKAMRIFKSPHTYVSGHPGSKEFRCGIDLCCWA